MAAMIMAEVADERGFTHDDLQTMPDDGHRYEIIDGSLIVTPAPRYRHQSALAGLFRLVDGACPAGSTVFFAPFDVKISTGTVLQPDLLVAPTASFDEMSLPGPPLLAVEVLSPSTRHIDLSLKWAAYEAAGTPSFWVVDPAVPSVIAWELVDGVYVEAGRAEAEQDLTPELPFPVRIVPAALLD